MKRLFLLVLLVCLTASAHAGNCRVSGVTPLNFGSYSVFSGAGVDISGTLTVQCSPGTSAVVSLSTGGSGSYATRTLQGPSVLPYNVYADATRTLIWGSGSAGSSVATLEVPEAEPGEKEFELPFYGRLMAGADVSAGTYSDTLMMTVEWDQNRRSTQALAVTATVVSECRVGSTDLDFGSYDPIGTHQTQDLTAESTISVRCTKGTSASVGLSLGTNGAGSQRYMLGAAGSHLGYTLFLNSSRTQTWNLTQRVTGVSTSKDLPLGGGLYVFGSIPGGQDVRSGTYADTVQAVVNY
ncbi:MAG: spore coat U domain-containing protein [Acidobacteria bacterium]|nr:spore coat U domain-containing protein [Acidobacteriota bacterium]